MQWLAMSGRHSAAADLLPAGKDFQLNTVRQMSLRFAWVFIANEYQDWITMFCRNTHSLLHGLWLCFDTAAIDPGVRKCMTLQGSLDCLTRPAMDNLTKLNGRV